MCDSTFRIGICMVNSSLVTLSPSNYPSSVRVLSLESVPPLCIISCSHFHSSTHEGVRIGVIVRSRTRIGGWTKILPRML